MGAISIDTAINRAVIDHDECVECGTCFRGMSQEHLNPLLRFEAKNPITHLMTDTSAGTLKEDVLDEKILSANRRDQDDQ